MHESDVPIVSELNAFMNKYLLQTGHVARHLLL